MNNSKVIFDIFFAPRDFAAEVRTGMEICWRALKDALKEAAPSVSTPTTATKNKFPFDIQRTFLPSWNRLETCRQRSSTR
jgi:hypothetical protein